MRKVKKKQKKAMDKPIKTYNLWGGFIKFILHHIKLRWEFVSRKFFKSEFIPVYIAILIFVVVAVVSGTMVVYDTNSHITSYRKMQQLFLDSGYDLEKIRNKEIDVPRIFIKSLPDDFNMIESPKEKKDLFIKFLLPLILKKNDELKAGREKLLKIKEKLTKNQKLSNTESEFFNYVKQEYKTETGNIDDILAKLDEISVSMALGQAIQETGWGESRFLIKGNSIFAEWTWGGEGMLPRARKSGLIHRIKTFPTLYDSVDSYANNLNKTRYYAGFRKMRAKLREQGKPLFGRWLMSSMIHYSTEKDKYILDVKRIVRDNNLDDFNEVKLVKEEKIQK
ncbi:MAG: glucosaminidase domain-containing protein [Alphaproteobacteria bacterium]|nr:glucosaminidase domain-containing protein [Alphaproteobacteria bacterium]